MANFYDPQLIRLTMTNEQIDAEHLAIIEEKGGDASDAEQARWAAIAEVSGAKERIEEMAGKLLAHFQKRTR